MLCFLPKVSTSIVTNDFLKDGSSDFLSDDENKKHQMLSGMLIWIVTLGMFDFSHALLHFSRFAAAPRAGNLG